MSKMVKLFVGNLGQNITPEDLKKLFEQFGNVSESDVIRNFGFVHMNDEEEAKKAFQELNNFVLNGRAIHLEYSTSKLRKDPGMDEVCFRCGDSGHKTNNCPQHEGGNKDAKASKRPARDSQGYPPAKRVEMYYTPPPPNRVYPGSATSGDYYARAAVEDPLLPRPVDRTLAPLYEDYLVARERYYYSRDRLERETRGIGRGVVPHGMSHVPGMTQQQQPVMQPAARDYYAATNARSPPSNLVRYPDVYYSRTPTGYEAYAIPSARTGY